MSGPQQTSSMTIHSSGNTTYFPPGQTGSQDASQSHLSLSDNQMNSFASCQDPLKGTNQFQPPAPHYTSSTNFQTTDATDDYNHHHYKYDHSNQANTWSSVDSGKISQSVEVQGPAGVNKRTVLDEVWSKVDPRLALTFAFLVALGTVVCILTEDEVPLSYVLSCISILSLSVFIKKGW